MSDTHTTSPLLRQYVWLANFGVAMLCFSWLPWWFTGDSWSMTILILGSALGYGLISLEGKIRPEIASYPDAYRRYAFPISVTFFCVIAVIACTIAFTQHRPAVWAMSSLSILTATAAPLGARFDPIRFRKKAPNQASQPTPLKRRG